MAAVSRGFMLATALYLKQPRDVLLPSGTDFSPFLIGTKEHGSTDKMQAHLLYLTRWSSLLLALFLQKEDVAVHPLPMVL